MGPLPGDWDGRPTESSENNQSKPGNSKSRMVQARSPLILSPLFLPRRLQRESGKPLICWEWNDFRNLNCNQAGTPFLFQQRRRLFGRRGFLARHSLLEKNQYITSTATIPISVVHATGIDPSHLIRETFSANPPRVAQISLRFSPTTKSPSPR